LKKRDKDRAQLVGDVVESRFKHEKKESLLQKYVEKHGDINGAQYVVGLQAAVGILEKVDLLAETCSCMYMQKHKIPCRHFIKAMICDMEIDGDRNKYMVKDYFHSAYLVEHVYAVVLQASNVTVPVL
jgi:SWIM zinc finger